jgi:hypothetical protein
MMAVASGDERAEMTLSFDEKRKREKERNAKGYLLSKQRVENGLCRSCGKKRGRSMVHCDVCLVKVRKYQGFGAAQSGIVRRTSLLSREKYENILRNLDQ